MGSSSSGESQTVLQLTELEDRIRKAGHLIGELREKNYHLSGELAELKREVALLSASSGDGSDAAAGVGSDAALAKELEVLRREREVIRARVQQVLERVERLDS